MNSFKEVEMGNNSKDLMELILELQERLKKLENSQSVKKGFSGKSTFLCILFMIIGVLFSVSVMYAPPAGTFGFIFRTKNAVGTKIERMEIESGVDIANAYVLNANINSYAKDATSTSTLENSPKKIFTASAWDGVGSALFRSMKIYNAATSAGASPTYELRIDDNSDTTLLKLKSGKDLELNGSYTLLGIAAPGISGVGQGRIYFDSIANKFKCSENGGSYFNCFAGSDTVGGSGTAGYIAKFTGTNTIGNSVLFESAGNVGIGTIGSVAKLEVAGGSADWNETTPGLTAGSIHLDPENTTNNFGSAITWGASDSGSGDTAQAGIYVRSDGTYGTKMYFATTDAYITGSKTRMFIGHTGNVGIGTTAPGGKLEVNMGNNNDYFRVNNDVNVGLELRSGSSLGTPFIDFTNDSANDHDARIVYGSSSPCSANALCIIVRNPITNSTINALLEIK